MYMIASENNREIPEQVNYILFPTWPLTVLRNFLIPSFCPEANPAYTLFFFARSISIQKYILTSPWIGETQLVSEDRIVS